MRTDLLRGCLLGWVFLPTAAAVAQQTGASVWPTWHPYPYGGRTATMGGAGIAAGRDSAMPLLNPAGLAQLDRRNLSLSASAYTVHALKVDGFFTSADAGENQALLEGDPQTHGPLDDMRSQTLDAFPTSFVYSHPFGAPVGESGHQVVSFAVLVPLRFDEGLRGRYALDSAGARVDWLIARKTQAASYHLGPTYAAQLGRHVRLGVGVFGLYQTFSRRTSLTDRLYYGAEGQDGSTTDTTDATSLDGLVSAGLQVALPAGFQVGFAARSPSIHFGGHLEKDATAATHASAGMVLDGVSAGGFTQVVRLRTDEFEIRHPLHLGAGFGWERPGRFAVAVDAHYIGDNDYRWARGALDETFRAEDGTTASTRTSASVQAEDDWLLDLNVGLEIFVTEMMAVRLGAFTDLSPASAIRSQPDQRDLFRRKVNLYGGTAGLGFLLGAVDFTVGAVMTTGEGDLAAMKNPADATPGAQFPVARVTETRLTGIVTGGVTFGEAVAPVARGLEKPVAAVAARFRNEPPRTLRLRDLDPALAPLEGGPRDDLSRRTGPDGAPDPIVYEVVGDPVYDALFRDVARLEAAAVVLHGALARVRAALDGFRETLADSPPGQASFDATSSDAALTAAVRGLEGGAGVAREVTALRAVLEEEARLSRRTLAAMRGEVAAIAGRARDLFERARSEGAVDAAVAIAVATRQCLARAQSAGRALAELSEGALALFGPTTSAP
jgi:hypothetical protein